ncbi:topology modulation protein [Geomicrobium sp. JCM 19038]|uniref:topology modulation protein n=1 Tax=Geomicrobium sp. JCM 19038 TaxID=1460635 RepID=UPI00045F1349|nr:topology modulation protein [Geomicrobium sp. JCM 19038]GAK08100.1 DNA topology modulation protein [Geomicrobium sp. JCM 19038]
MNRVMVMGVSAGVGKSTFAKELGKRMQIPVHHLDAYYWKPGWEEVSYEEFLARQHELIACNKWWIIEGNYTQTYTIRAKNADTIIYLELPLYVCLYRVIKRRLFYHGRTRPDMGEGCKEKLDMEFLRFICSTYYPRKKKMKDRFVAFQEGNPSNKVIVLKSRKEIRSYLETLHS